MTSSPKDLLLGRGLVDCGAGEGVKSKGAPEIGGDADKVGADIGPDAGVFIPDVGGLGNAWESDGIGSPRTVLF